ncbi:MAG: DNA methyltransferase [Phycisphaerae bacterium]|nr:DNA methyltransferase [Phycisphaerae bacterium]
MSKFEELVAKLAELFELDKADLDFGIHRIIKQKHAQITQYLTATLPSKVKAVLSELSVAQNAERLEELKTRIIDEFGRRAFDDNGTLVDTAAQQDSLGQQYLSLLETTGNAADLDRIETEVYSHLYDFFSRYYDDADFISLRRSSNKSKYAIPYNGEEVLLHWANKDQYYIKSSEDMKDYTFNIEQGGNSYRVKFKLSRMDAVQNNNVAKRLFVIDDEADVEEVDNALVIPFHFKEFTGRTPNNNQLVAELETVINAKVPTEWKQRLGTNDETYTGTDGRTVLQKHLQNYTKKNTSDYFIHKDLGAFLTNELDFYIKNEVMYLDDIDDRPANYLEAEIRKIKAIRLIAKDLIAFLAQFEDFQKKLWLKKKFIYETNYCITLDRIPETMYSEIAANDAQRQEWIKLFAIDEITAATGDLLQTGSPAYSDPLTVEFLKANPFLVLDTCFFDADFKYRLLDSIDDIDAQLNGFLIHSENFQALNLLQKRYKEQIKCVYIDPPYNTSASEIIYKNGYKSSSWLSYIENRISTGKDLISKDGMQCITIDDFEFAGLRYLLEQLYSEEGIVGVAAIKNNPSGRATPKGFSISHEYALFTTKSEFTAIGRLSHSEEQISRYNEQDEKGRFEWVNFRKHGGANANRYARPKLFYPIFASEDNLRIPSMEWDVDNNEWILNEEPRTDEQIIYPVDSSGVDKTWKWGSDTARDNPEEFRVGIDQDRKRAIYRKARINEEGTLPRTIWDKKEYSSTAYGTNLLANIMGEKERFSFPKSVHAVEDCLRVSNVDKTSCVLDYFAGSGTTGHSVINLNREDGGQRKYILVEMGEYFDTVLKSRIQKATYSIDWSQGKPSARNTGISQCFKYIRLESYEDTLNNLEMEDRQQDLLGLSDEVQQQYLINYMLDIETRGSLLALDRFENPFDTTLKIYNRETGTAEPKQIDLPETFNYLLGLRVREVKMRDGFLTIEGENPVGETVLVIWRNVTEKDNAALEQFVTETLRINTADTEYHAIYINGDTTLNDPHKKILLTEEIFHNLMFDIKQL